ncbi:hypothetical protein [Angustibacter sp. Root456]|uniref:hypothetical protein n=1 Tax=Angustibacter sp. Root456 TaxID=1736539 RepID=UPI0006F1FAE5|nr:hypothetical protein [Angustibacter sp. Root456]KQX64378.1 hypothetical protein ASD06_09330 [Angustibacter sp. Root456]
MDDGSDSHPELVTMVIMDDETDHLLDAFLDAASGERTPTTRQRYERTLAPLRSPVDGESDCGPGVRLLLRVADQLGRAAADQLPSDQYDTMPSLYGRLVTWLRRHSDAGAPAAQCVRLETLAVLRDVRRERLRERYGDPTRPAVSAYDDELPDPWWEDAVYSENLYTFPAPR